MMDSVFSEKIQLRFSRWLQRHYHWVLLGTLLLTVVTTLEARQLSLQSNMIKLLPERTPSVVAMQSLLDKVGGAGDLIVMIESGSPEASLRYADDLLPKVRALPWVGSARIGKDTAFFDENRLLYVDLPDLKTIEQRVERRMEYENLQAQPFYIDLEEAPPPSLDFSDIEEKYLGQGHRSRYFRNADGTILLLIVHPRGTTSDLNFGKKIYAELQALVATTQPADFEAGMQVEVGGTFRNRIEEMQTIISDVTASSLVVAFGILLLISLYFRHALAAVFVMLPLAMSMSWTFAIAALLIGSLNLVTVFLIVVLMGLGIDFGIHMLARYQSERARGEEPATAIAFMLARAGRASLVAALTTAVCFYSLLATEFRGFVEFGMIAGTGLIMSALSFFLVLPALLSLAAARGWMQTDRQPGPAGRGGRLKHARSLFAVCVVVIAGSAWIGGGAEFEYDLRNLRAKKPTTRSFNSKVRQVFPAARDPAAVLVPDARVAVAVQKELERRRLGEGDSSPIEKVVSTQDLLPSQQEAKLLIMSGLGKRLDDIIDIVDEEKKPELENLRADLAVPKIENLDGLPDELLQKFVGRPGSHGEVVYVYQRGSLMDLRVAEKFAHAVADLKIESREYRAISEPLIFVDMIELLKRDTPLALLLSGLALLLLLYVDLRSPGRVLIVVVPLASGLALMAVAMVLVPIRLNLLNAVVLPSILGLGVDGGVHMYHSLNEHGPDRMWKVLRETGGPVAICTITSMLGFAGLLVADHPGLRSIGMLALFGLAGCLFGAVVVLPSLVGSLVRRR